jgi:1-acyl-sn-glycerol-3-phosphate acyltransferase
MSSWIEERRLLETLWLALVQAGIPRYEPDRFDQRDPLFVQRVVDLVERFVIPYHRAEIKGVDRIPSGPALYVGNHSGGLLSLDTLLLGAAVFRHRGMEDLPFGLAHDVIVDLPIWNQILVPLGAIRARPEYAQRLLELGHKVLVYPGGDIEALRPFRERKRIKFSYRQGYIRTALHHQVPIIPVVSAGAQETFFVVDDLPWLARLLRADERLRINRWPLSLSLPWGLSLGPPPPHIPLPTRIRVEILEPIFFSAGGDRDQERDPCYVSGCAERVENTMQRALNRLYR